MTPSKNARGPPKIFFSIFSKNVASSKKLFDEEIVSKKKVIFIFVARHTFPSKGTWPLETVF